MNVSVSLSICLKKQPISRNPFYIFRYMVNRRINSPYSIFTNYFSLNINEYEIFAGVLNNLKDTNPRFINLKINDYFHKYCYLGFRFDNKKEYLTPKETELGIRSLVVKKPDHYLLKTTSEIFENIYNLNFEIPDVDNLNL